MALLKGLHPAAEKPEEFGPRAVAEMNMFSKDSKAFLDEDLAYREQVEKWKKEAAEYEELNKTKFEQAQEVLKKILPHYF